jgi:hypothetical protein
VRSGRSEVPSRAGGAGSSSELAASHPDLAAHAGVVAAVAAQAVVVEAAVEGVVAVARVQIVAAGAAVDPVLAGAAGISPFRLG